MSNKFLCNAGVSKYNISFGMSYKITENRKYLKIVLSACVTNTNSLMRLKLLTLTFIRTFGCVGSVTCTYVCVCVYSTPTVPVKTNWKRDSSFLCNLVTLKGKYTFRGLFKIIFNALRHVSPHQPTDGNCDMLHVWRQGVTDVQDQSKMKLWLFDVHKCSRLY